MSRAGVPEGVRLEGGRGERFDEILSYEALAFLAELHRRFEPRRRELLAARVVRQGRIDSGELPDFLSATQSIRSSEWRIAGLQIEARLGDGFTLDGSGTFNHAYQTNSPCLTTNNRALPNYGQCITEVNGLPFSNPFGGEGSVPAFSPRGEGSLRLRYDRMIGQYDLYVMIGANYVGGMWSEPSTYPGANSPQCYPEPTGTRCRYYQPAYHTFFGGLGISKDNWHVDLNGTNLNNSDASVFTSSAQFIKTEVPLRPRVVSVTVGYNF